MARPHRVKYSFDPSVVVHRHKPTYAEEVAALAERERTFQCLHPELMSDTRCEAQPGPPIYRRFKPMRADGTEADNFVTVNVAPRCGKPAPITRRRNGRTVHLCCEHAR